MSVASRLCILCRMIKIEHSIFALPFAFLGTFLASGGWPGIMPLIPLTTAMVCIRSFAMTFNRIADLRFDAANPRTATRALVTGELRVSQAWLFCAAMAAGFVASCAALNMLCLQLSPLALFLAAFYSYTKRFTWLCHFALGAVLAMAPIGGWLAVSPSFAYPPLFIGLAVLFWTAGFDILYASQDIAFDRQHKLHSIPATFELPAAFAIAAFSHVNMVVFLVLAGMMLHLAWPWFVVCAIISALLYWEHHMLHPDDLTRVNTAFFIINAAVAVALFAGALLALYWPLPALYWPLAPGTGNGI